MSLFNTLFGVKPKQDGFAPLLKATIIFDEDTNASVSIEKLHPDSPVYEYIKLVLMLYSKMLVNMPPEQPSTPVAAALLINGMGNIASSRLDEKANLLKIANIDDVVKLATPKGTKYIYTATLKAVSGTERQIETDIPEGGTEQQSVFIVPLTVMGVLKYLGPEEIALLQRAIKIMTDKYKNGYDYSNLTSFYLLPNKTFLEVISS